MNVEQMCELVNVLNESMDIHWNYMNFINWVNFLIILQHLQHVKHTDHKQSNNKVCTIIL